MKFILIVISILLFGCETAGIDSPEEPLFQIRQGINDLYLVSAAREGEIPDGLVLMRSLKEDYWLVSSEILIVEADIESATVVQTSDRETSGEEITIQLYFTPAGSKKLLLLSHKFMGLQLVIIFKGSLLYGATIKGVFDSGKLQVVVPNSHVNVAKDILVLVNQGKT